MGYLESRITELMKKLNRGENTVSAAEDLLKIALEMAVVIDDLTDAVDELDMRLIELEAEEKTKE